VESRAQMATLPRLKPKVFYDLVVEVALIRPGPIQGGSVHPYIRRANGLEDPDPPHELLEKTLERTKGVPLFQEQLMQTAFCAALLNAQPMGFYSPQSLVDDARRHGVTVRRPDINASKAKAILEPGARYRSDPGEPPEQWGRDGPVVRMGIGSVRSISEDLADRIEIEHHDHGPYRDMADLARRIELSTADLEALATAAAFACLGLSPR